MVAVPFPLSSTPGRLVGEGEGRLVNAFTEKLGDTMLWRRAPSPVNFAAAGKTGPRGMIDVAGTVYAAYSGGVVRIDSAGPVTNLAGSIPGTDPVTWARNNKAGTPDLVAVRRDGGAYVVSSSAVSAYPDADLPGTVNSVAFLGGYLVFTVPDGRIFASDLNTTAVNALSVATAESRPDGLVRGIVHGGTYYAFGTATIEPFLNVGTTPFPLLRHTSVVEVGLLAAAALAGAEEGWDNNLFFVAHDRTVRELTGYTTRTVSTPPVEDFISRSDPVTLEACVYTHRGHSIWSLSSSIGTWEFDVSTRQWRERTTTGLARWRGSRSVKSSGRWLIGDTSSTALLQVSETTFTEPWTVESGPLRDFPARAAVPDILFDFTPIAGISVAVSWSLDGGETWSTPLTRPIRGDGAPRRPVQVSPSGMFSHHGLRLRCAVTDPGEFSFRGASVTDLEARRP